MQPTMSDLVDRGRVRSTRVVANPKRSKDQDRLAFAQLDAEDHAEFAIRGWQPQLQAMLESGSFWPLLIASEKVVNRHPFGFKLFASRKRYLFPCIACSPQVLGKGSVIEQRSRAAWPLVAHRLPLAIGGLNRAVLGLEVSQRSRLGAEALPDRVEGGIRHEGERPVGALLGNDVLASAITTELDVGELHAKDFRRPPLWWRILGEIRRLGCIEANVATHLTPFGSA